MKLNKLVFSCVLMLVGHAAFADVMLVNKSKNQLEVVYQFCDVKPSEGSSCSAPEISTLGGVDNKDKNKSYMVVDRPQFSPANQFTEQRLLVLSATEKDAKGNVVAKTSYVDVDSPELEAEKSNTCYATTAYVESYHAPFIKSSNAVAMVFDDLNQSQMLTCQRMDGAGMTWKRMS